MKYKSGDLLRNKKTGEVRMVEGLGWGYGNDISNTGYVVNVFFGGATTWQDKDVELVMTKKELLKKLKLKDIYANDNPKLMVLRQQIQEARNGE